MKRAFLYLRAAWRTFWEIMAEPLGCAAVISAFCAACYAAYRYEDIFWAGILALVALAIFVVVGVVAYALTIQFAGHVGYVWRKHTKELREQ